jgi:hypothetical protein
MTEWLCHPQAEDFIEQHVAALPAACTWQKDLAFTNTRLVDWLDHLTLANSAGLQGKLAELGFIPEDVAAETGDTVYYHPCALLPRVILRDGTSAGPGAVVALAVRVEDANQFIQVHQMQATIEGTPFGPYRRARVWQQNGCEFLIVERRGYWGFVPVEAPPDYPLRYLHAFERWNSRPRQFDDARRALSQALSLARSLINELGTNLAAWVIFAAERDYWQRHYQEQVTSSREDRLGMGWVNRNHYTFRSSRKTFGALVQLLEILGFGPHLCFNASARIGWGAQVLQQPACRVTVFVDLDSSDTIENEPKLWCTLHGESMLIAGLYHLIGRFVRSDKVSVPLSGDLEAIEPVGLMAGWEGETINPFATLRQALAQEQAWDVHASSRRAN